LHTGVFGHRQSTGGISYAVQCLGNRQRLVSNLGYLSEPNLLYLIDAFTNLNQIVHSGVFGYGESSDDGGKVAWTVEIPTINARAQHAEIQTKMLPWDIFEKCSFTAYGKCYYTLADAPVDERDPPRSSSERKK